MKGGYVFKPVCGTFVWPGNLIACQNLVKDILGDETSHVLYVTEDVIQTKLFKGKPTDIVLKLVVWHDQSPQKEMI